MHELMKRLWRNAVSQANLFTLASAFFSHSQTYQEDYHHFTAWPFLL